MKHDIMTIDEVADYLRTSERAVADWVQKGLLPGGRIEGSWRFKRTDVEACVNRNPVVKTAPSSSSTSAINLASILSADRVLFLDSTAKQDALRQLCGVLATSPLIMNPGELEEAIFRRESLMSTGIGFGVGVPHVRLPSVTDLVMALGIALAPIADYQSLDDAPVSIVCMVAAGGTQHTQYIRALSCISTRLKDNAVRQTLVTALSPLAAYRLFIGEGS